MKKYNLFKIVSVAFLSSLVITMYSTKFKSIVLSVDLLSYFIFACVTVICGLLLLNKEDISDWIQMISKKEKKTEDIPDTVYNFCKKYYFESEADTISFVKNNVKNKSLANFFVRYLDKNTIEEIDEYLATQEVAVNRKKDNARKVINYNNLFILLGVIASYIYDSNIKGVLMIAGALSVYNLIVSKNIESNIVSLQQTNALYKMIAEDILNFKNAKYIMYRCKSILMLDDEFVSVDNIEVPKHIDITEAVENHSTENNISIPTDLNIEGRKSALITIGKNKNKQTDNNKKVVNL